MIPNELYLVTCNGYLDKYGASIFCIGVFESPDDASDAINAQPEALRSECKIIKLHLGDRHDMSSSHEDFYYENDLCLGGYIE